MHIPAAFVVQHAAMAMDGGSIHLSLQTEQGEGHGLRLAQHRIPSTPGEKYIRGRLYFDGELVPIRSQAEAQILAALRRAPIAAPAGPPGAQRQGPGMVVGDDIKAFLSKIAEGPAAAAAHLVAELITFVESDEYLTFAAQ